VHTVDVVPTAGRSLRSGELAALAGISTDTLRHYERMGVLPVPQRSEGNYRLYPAHAVDRVRLIRRSLSVGFSLAELAKILKARDQGRPPCRQVRALMADKLSQLEQEIGQLQAMRDHLRTVLCDWDERLDRTPDGQPAKLLETLSLPATPKGKPNEALSRTRFVRRSNGLPGPAR
jgi:DNA-binding transcriptional MerR regulator